MHPGALPVTDEPKPRLVPAKTGMARLIAFLVEQAQRKAYCTVTLTIQRGQIERVHVDQSFTMDELPVKDLAAAGKI